jgi:hypothetical protein
MSKIETNTIEPSTGTTLTLGASGDDVKVVGTLKEENPILFWAYRSTNYALTSTHTKLVFDTAQHNFGSHYNTTTGYFTAPKAGLYEFAVSAIGFNDPATTMRYNFYKNDTIYSPKYELRLDGSGGTSTYGTNSEYLIYDELSANDTVSIYASSDSNGTGYGASGFAYTYFRGRYIG